MKNKEDVEKIHCIKKSHYLMLGLSQMPMVFVIFLGLIVSGFIIEIWWIPVSYVVFCILFFGVIERRLLCTHCPYYCNGKKKLYCFTSWGQFKFFKERPWPMSRIERNLFLYMISILFYFPDVLFIISFIISIKEGDLFFSGAMFGVCFLSIILQYKFYHFLRNNYCKRCLHLSCPIRK